MDESIVDEVAGLPASVPEVTATPEPEVSTPEEKPAKTFTQEEVDALVSKRLAREQRKWDRELKKTNSVPVATAPAVPKPDSFSSPEEADAYAEAVADRKAEELLAQREAERQRQETVDAYHDREEQAREKYDDFEQVVYNPSLRITTVMAETIQTSEVGPDLAYYLGSNPKEAQRIAKLPPYLQAKEIGKIEVKLADNPPVKKTSSAPAPITPVTARSTTAPAYDTTDPRSIKSMSTSEWIEAERARQRKKYDAQKLR
jgi:hypothetical protein